MGAAFQPRSAFMAATEIAAGKPLPHLIIKRPLQSRLFGIAREEDHLNFVYRTAAAGIFLYLLVQAILSTPALRDKYASYRWIPLFTAMIWLVHPIQTQSVTYLVQRMNSLSAMFYILSLLLYAKARLAEGKRKKWLLFSGCVKAGILITKGLQSIQSTCQRRHPQRHMIAFLF